MVEKKVESNEYELLKGVSQFLTVKELSQYRKVSKTAIYKGLKKLIGKGLIRKLGNSYQLSEVGFTRLNSLMQSSNQIRLHNLAFKVKIINKPNNWDLMRSKILDLRTMSKQVDLKNNSYQLHHFKNLKVKTTTNSIIFYMPSIYAINTDLAFKESLDLLFESIPKVESIFKICLIKDRKANIEIISQHYAKLQDSMAKLYKQEGNKLYITDEQGKIWLISDFSFSVSELETIDTNRAKEDMDTVKDFLNDLRKNPATMTNVLELVREVTANQVVFDKNFKSHLELIKTLGQEIKGLSKSIRSIKKENTQLKLGNQTTLDKW